MADVRSGYEFAGDHCCTDYLDGVRLCGGCFLAKNKIIFKKIRLRNGLRLRIENKILK